MMSVLLPQKRRNTQHGVSACGHQLVEEPVSSVLALLGQVSFFFTQVEDKTLTQDREDGRVSYRKGKLISRDPKVLILVKTFPCMKKTSPLFTDIQKFTKLVNYNTFF